MAHAILICDDDPDLRMALRRTLRGYEIAESGSPDEAIEMLATRAFDAIISDLELEADRDGIELLEQVRDAYPAMLRVLVTANRGAGIPGRAASGNAAHKLFLKPWSDDELRASLQTLLSERRGS